MAHRAADTDGDRDRALKQRGVALLVVGLGTAAASVSVLDSVGLLGAGLVWTVAGAVLSGVGPRLSPPAVRVVQGAGLAVPGALLLRESLALDSLALAVVGATLAVTGVATSVRDRHPLAGPTAALSGFGLTAAGFLVLERPLAAAAMGLWVVVAGRRLWTRRQGVPG